MKNPHIHTDAANSNLVPIIYKHCLEIVSKLTDLKSLNSPAVEEELQDILELHSTSHSPFTY